MKKAANSIPGYDYGSPDLPMSPVTMQELQNLKITVGLTQEDEGYLRMAGEVLADQTRQIVEHWRSGIIANIPHLARHSQTTDDHPIPEYVARSNLRFEQWILDTCLRPYGQEWLNYQHEIAARHTSQKKNQVDHVSSTPFVPLRDVIGFIAVINNTIKPYLASKGSSAEDVSKMHAAWCKSTQLQMSLWIRSYTDAMGLPKGY